VIYLTVEDVLAVAARHGAVPRDLGLIEAAVARPQASAFGADAYPGLKDKAAALLHSMAANQAFVDGNKRVAWDSMVLFLRLNDVSLHAPIHEAHRFMVSITHHSDWRDIALTMGGWIDPEGAAPV
jgi:death on curing protein